jgi:hypothetical protein
VFGRTSSSENASEGEEPRPVEESVLTSSEESEADDDEERTSEEKPGGPDDNVADDADDTEDAEDGSGADLSPLTAEDTGAEALRSGTSTAGDTATRWSAASSVARGESVTGGASSCTRPTTHAVEEPMAELSSTAATRDSRAHSGPR